MAEYDLGTARGSIILDSDTKGVDQANAALKDIDTNSQKAGVSAQKVGTGMAVAGAAIVGGLAVAVGTAATFEQSLANIKAVSGLTSDGMKDVSAKALQLGKDTKFSASEAALAIEELSKAGLAMPDILNGAADATVALAAAGSIDLPQAATIASNAMNQFGLSAGDMVGVADSIAGAANASAIDVSEFGQSLSQVGAVANLAGVSFEDTATAIALMGNAGIKGSDAGTSLKSMFSRLIPNTKEQKELMMELGLVTADGANQFYDAQGNLKGLADVSGTLQNALAGMTAEQKQATLQTLFGSDAIRAAAVLSKDGAAGFNEMATAIGKVSASDTAAVKMDTFSGSLEAMKGSLETVGITIGTVFLPILRDLVDFVGSLFNKFLELDEGTQKIIGFALAGAAAFLLLGAGMIKAVGFAKNLVGALKSVGTALKIMRLENIKAAAAWTVHTAKLIAHKVASIAMAVATGVVKAATAAYTAVQWLLNAAMSANPIGLIIIAIAALVAAFIWLWNNVEGFRNFFIAIWEGIQDVVGTVVDWFVNTAWPFLQSVWDGIKSGLEALWNVYVTVWTAIFNVVKTVITTIWNVIQTVWNFIYTFIVTYLNLLWTVWSTIWNAIVAVVQFVWNAIVAAIQAAVGFIQSAIDGIRTIIEKVAGFFQRMYDAVVEKVGALISFVTGIPGKILGALGDVGRLLFDAGKRIITGLLDGLKDGFNKVKDFVGGIGSWIADHKGPKEYDLKLLQPAGGWIMDGLRKGLESQLAPLTADLNVIGSAIGPAVAGGAGNVPQALSGISPPVAALGTAPPAAVAGEKVFNVTINNPEPEPASESLFRSMQKLAYIGIGAED